MGFPANLSNALSTPQRVDGRDGPSRLAGACELLLLLVVLLWCLWTDNRRVLSSAARTAGALVLTATVIGLLWRQRPTPTQLGLRPTHWLAGTGELAVVTGVGVLSLLGAGWWAGTIGNVDNFGRWLLRNWHMEGLQQLLLQVLLVPRLSVLLRDHGPRTLAVAAVLFSLLHAPNLLLMSLTLPAAFWWSHWFQRYRNLPALWISHLLLAACLLYCLNGQALGNLRVGIGYVFRH